MIFPTPPVRKVTQLGSFCRFANASRRELMVGGLDSGKVLRVVGMAATMRLSNHGPDNAVNHSISLLVLNEQAERPFCMKTRKPE